MTIVFLFIDLTLYATVILHVFISSLKYECTYVYHIRYALSYFSPQCSIADDYVYTDWSLRKLFGRTINGVCALASDSYVLVDMTHTVCKHHFVQYVAIVVSLSLRVVDFLIV